MIETKDPAGTSRLTPSSTRLTASPSRYSFTSPRAASTVPPAVAPILALHPTSVHTDRTEIV